jgi:hypothetical protein
MYAVRAKKKPDSEKPPIQRLGDLPGQAELLKSLSQIGLEDTDLPHQQPELRRASVC